MKHRIILLFMVSCALPSAAQGLFYVENEPMLTKPVVFCDLGDSIFTPDGMAIDPQGRLFLSVPNFANHRALGSKICVISSDGVVKTWLDSLPIHPVSRNVYPMGIEFGPDGNLYIADAQGEVRNKPGGRLLRVVVKKGKPIRSEVLVEGFRSANGLRWNGRRVYISDSYIPVEGKRGQSGVYSFSLDELNSGMILLQENGKDPHLLTLFSCRDIEGEECTGGADGMAFDGNGVLYAGSFGDGVIYRIVLDSEGKKVSQEAIVDSEMFRCCDGMFYDAASNSIYIANFLGNSVHRLDLSAKKLELLWKNGEPGEDGALLDQPCEPILYKGRLLVVNFDGADGTRTISAFDIARAKQ